MEPQRTDTTSQPAKNPPRASVEGFIAAARLLRKATGLVATSVWILRYRQTHETSEHLNRVGQMSANLSLACRHLEEAAECLGKASKAADGGAARDLKLDR